MQRAEPQIELIHATPNPLGVIARFTRLCRQSPPGDDTRLVRTIIRLGHTSQLEHVTAGFILTTTRTVSHQLVRHRVGTNFSQQSQRLQKAGGELIVQEPPGLSPAARQAWERGLQACELSYQQMLAAGCSGQIARSILPGCTQTQLGLTANFRAWRWLLAMRAFPEAQPETRALAMQLYPYLQQLCPVVFETVPSVEETQRDMQLAYAQYCAQSVE